MYQTVWQNNSPDLKRQILECTKQGAKPARDLPGTTSMEIKNFTIEIVPTGSQAPGEGFI